MGVCFTALPHPSWVFPPDAQEGGLRFLAEIVDGPAHRGYSGTGVGHTMPNDWSCPNKSTARCDKEVFWLNTVNAADATWVPQVSAHGLTAAGTADDGSMVYTLSFAFTPEQ